jgi:hypothetical protein
MSRNSLVTAAKKALGERVQRIGFKRGVRDWVYYKVLDTDSRLYFMCQPRMQSRQVLLEPIVAIENQTLRRLMGEDQPKQIVPRLAHVFLSYTIDRDITFWSFSDAEEMKRAIDAIEDALRKGGIPFAERWAPFRAAVDLLRRGFSGNVPRGVFTHPTRSCRAVLENLPETHDRIH